MNVLGKDNGGNSVDFVPCHELDALSLEPPESSGAGISNPALAKAAALAAFYNSEPISIMLPTSIARDANPSIATIDAATRNRTAPRSLPMRDFSFVTICPSFPGLITIGCMLGRSRPRPAPNS